MVFVIVSLINEKELFVISILSFFFVVMFFSFLHVMHLASSTIEDNQNRDRRYAVSVPYRTVPYRDETVLEKKISKAVRYGMRYQMAIPHSRVIARSLLTMIFSNICCISGVTTLGPAGAQPHHRVFKPHHPYF